jgi:hypothetical protein
MDDEMAKSGAMDRMDMSLMVRWGPEKHNGSWKRQTVNYRKRPWRQT